MTPRHVALLNPKYWATHYSGAPIPAGLGYVAQSLADHGIPCTVLDMCLGYSESQVLRRIRELEVDVLGVGFMTYRYRDTYRLIRSIRAEFPDLTIVAGGPHVSTFREDVLAECPQIDVAFTLEGDRSLVEFLDRGTATDSPGAITLRDGKPVCNEDRPFIQDLDALGWPRYEEFELQRYIGATIPIVTSRGCPFGCIYCPVKTTIGSQFRARSAGSVVDEIVYWYKRGYRRFAVADDCFTLWENRVIEICDGIRSAGLSEIELSCSNGIRADRASRRTLEAMRGAGWQQIAFGVEAGNDRILRGLGKGEKLQQIDEAVAMACRLGFHVTLFFMIGAPGETPSDVADSVRFALKYDVADIRFYNMIPWPRTPLFRWVCEKGRFLLPPADYLNSKNLWRNRPVFATPEFGRRARARLLRRTKRLRRRIRQRYYRRRMAGFGFLARPLAWLYASDFLQNVALRNRWFATKIDYLKRALSARGDAAVQRPSPARILLVTEEFPPVAAGVSHYLYGAYRSVSPEHLEVLTAKAAPPHPDIFPMPWRVVRRGYFAEGHPNRWIRVLGQSLQIVCLVFDALGIISRERITDIHFAYPLPSGLAGVILKKLTGVRMRVFCHGKEIMGSAARSGLKAAALRFVLNRADSIAAVSHFTRDRILEFGVDPQKVRVVSPSVDRSRFHPGRDGSRIRRQFGLEHKRVILTVGRLVERKGHDVVIRALPRILDNVPVAHYLIAGDGPFRPRLEQLVDKLGLRPWVTFAGRFPDRLTPDFYAAADAFVMASRQLDTDGDVEGFGIVFLEASASGLPVVGGDSGGVPEAVARCQRGTVVPPTDTEAVADALVKYLAATEAPKRTAFAPGGELVRDSA